MTRPHINYDSSSHLVHVVEEDHSFEDRAGSENPILDDRQLTKPLMWEAAPGVGEYLRHNGFEDSCF